jgi:hypothetical protein
MEAIMTGMAPDVSRFRSSTVKSGKFFLRAF